MESEAGFTYAGTRQLIRRLPVSEQGWFAGAPMLLLFIATIVFVVLALAAGMRLGARARARGAESIGSAVAATLGLLAFMLGFAFNMAANRFDERKHLFTEEVNAIETAYLRAGLLAEPWKSEFRNLVRQYVDVRARFARDNSLLAETIETSGEIHAALWALMERKAAAATPLVTDSLVIQSLNEVIDLHSERVVVGLQYRIPTTIWFGLYAVAALAMLMVGFQFGQSDHRQPIVILAMALSFSAVIMLIMDLDRAGQGTVRIDQRPLLELQRRLHAAPAAESDPGGAGDHQL